jgi:hypothetical protein
VDVETYLPLAVGGVLVGAAAMLIALHRQAWRSVDRGLAAQSEQNFAAAQYRRRVQTSAMIGVVGVLIAGGPWVPPGWVMAGYWLVVVLLVLWLVMLALADALASRLHFGRIEQQQTLERLRLQALLRAARGESSPPQPTTDQTPRSGDHD